MTYRVLKTHPELLKKYQRHYRYIHVDEYQDTNRIQYLLLKLLVHSSAGGHQNICVVGDEDQSIYKWRGADIRNILDFELDYPESQIVKLEQNYRSSKTIIESAQAVIKNNSERKDKTLWTQNAEGQPLVLAKTTDERAEAEYIVGQIKRFARDEGKSFSDMAIFYRTHAQSRQFEDVFRREKIGYEIVGGLRFYDRKEIKDVLSYFKVIQNPWDSVSLKRIINSPARGIGKTTLEKIDEYQLDLERQTGQPKNWWSCLVEVSRPEQKILSQGTAKKIQTFVKIIENLAEKSAHLKLSELYHLLLDETGMISSYKSEGTDEAEARIENLEEMDSIILEFEEAWLGAETLDVDVAPVNQSLLEVFLEQTSLVNEQVPQGQEGPSSVKMMTLHSSKGLEFPIVFLPGMEEGLFPSIRPWDEQAESELEEERRLCYVGMTRARERLFLTHASMRRLWGQTQFPEPSRFLSEIPQKYLGVCDLTQARQSPYSYSKSEYTSQSPKAYSEVGTFGATPSGVVGQMIDHHTYGRGKIISQEGTGDQARLTIQFGQITKKFLLKYIAPYLNT